MKMPGPDCGCDTCRKYAWIPGAWELPARVPESPSTVPAESSTVSTVGKYPETGPSQ